MLPSFVLVVLALRRWRELFGWDSDDVLGSQSYLRGFTPFNDTMRVTFLMWYRLPVSWVIYHLRGGFLTPTRSLLLASCVWLAIILYLVNMVAGLFARTYGTKQQVSGTRILTVPLLCLFFCTGWMLAVVTGTTNHNIEAAIAVVAVAVLLMKPLRRKQVVLLALVIATASSSDPLVLINTVAPVCAVLAFESYRTKKLDPRLLVVLAIPMHLWITTLTRLAGIEQYGSPSLTEVALPSVAKFLTNQVTAVDYLATVVGGIDISMVPILSVHGLAWMLRIGLFGYCLRFCWRNRDRAFCRFAVFSIGLTTLTAGAFGPAEWRYFPPGLFAILAVLPTALEGLWVNLKADAIGPTVRASFTKRPIGMPTAIRTSVVILCFGLIAVSTEPWHEKNPRRPKYEAQLAVADLLNEHQVDILIADYWDSGIISYLSGRSVRGLIASCYNGQIYNRDMNMRRDWNLPDQASYAVYLHKSMADACNEHLPAKADYVDAIEGRLYFFNENPWPSLSKEPAQKPVADVTDATAKCEGVDCAVDWTS